MRGSRTSMRNSAHLCRNRNQASTSSTGNILTLRRDMPRMVLMAMSGECVCCCSSDRNRLCTGR